MDRYMYLVILKVFFFFFKNIHLYDDFFYTIELK